MDVERRLRIVARAAAALYIIVGFGELIFAGGSLTHRVVFAFVLLALAGLVVGGVALIPRQPWIGAAAAAAGAIAAGLALFWTIAAILLAIAIVVLAAMVARRTAAARTGPPEIETV
jgi:hypothetical protein